METQMIENYDWDRLKDLGFSEKTAEGLKSVCWKKSDHKEGDVATAEMTPNYLPKVPAAGPDKDPGNSKLAMRAAPNYAETEDFHDAFQSMEPNAGMAINQLRVMREKIDIMLGMLYPDDNLEPWCATKLAMSAQNLASVADDLRFGAEL